MTDSSALRLHTDAPTHYQLACIDLNLTTIARRSQTIGILYLLKSLAKYPATHACMLISGTKPIEGRRLLVGSSPSRGGRLAVVRHGCPARACGARARHPSKASDGAIENVNRKN